MTRMVRVGPPPERHVVKGCQHRIVTVEVVVGCECGDLFAGDTESGAIRDYEVHVQEMTEP